MELFNINRYVEEDDEETPSQDPSKVLKRLRKEAKRRRKTLESKETVDNGTIETEEQTDEAQTTLTTKKKKKKRKHETENGISEDAIDMNDVEITPKIKKKKMTTQNKKHKNEKEKDFDRAFAVIGEAPNDEKIAVRRVLPDWLTKPTLIAMDLRNDLVEVDAIRGLCPSIIAQLCSNKITHFFPVQSCVISWLLDSFTRNWIRQPDLCVSSPTGSGKTLAFALPIIHALSERFICSVKALIVLPVRDLATQVFEVFKTYSKGTHLRVGLANGQKSLNEEQQTLVTKGKRGYYSLIDILVCTPGRLVEHLTHTPGFSLIDLRFLVIDEVDRMMQQVKQDWLNVVEKNILKGHGELKVNKMSELRRMPQKLLFSATLSQNPEKLQEMKLFQPKLFTTSGATEVSTNGIENSEGEVEFVNEFVGRYTTPKELTEYYFQCKTFLKPLVILHFLHNLRYRHMFCFTNSVQSSHRLYMLLSAYGDICVKEFTSKLLTSERMKVLSDFTQGSIDVIVCSDTMARGMDVENVEYVVSYDLPRYLKSYVHRVGRTARAGRSGTAISLVTEKEISEFRKMMTTARKSVDQLSIDMEQLEPMEEKYRQSLEQVKTKIEKQRLKQFKGKDKRKIIPKQKKAK